MSLHPKSVTDLSLAPVAAEVDLNLRRLRDLSEDEITFRLPLELDRPLGPTAAERQHAVVDQALRGVELRGWQAELTPDSAAIRLSGGSVTLNVALGRAVEAYLAPRPVERLDPEN